MNNEVENTSKVERDALREIFRRACIVVYDELRRWKKARPAEELDKVVENEIEKKIKWVGGDGRMHLLMSKKDAVLRHAKRHAIVVAGFDPVFTGLGCLANAEEVDKELGIERVELKFEETINSYGNHQFFERQYKISVGGKSTAFKCYFPNLNILTEREAEIEYANFICRLRGKAKQAKRWLLKDLKSKGR